MNASQTLLMFELQRLESRCHGALAQIRRSLTMRDVVRHADVGVPSWVRPLTHSAPAYRQLRHAAEQRLEQLLQEQLTKLKQCADGDERQVRLHRLQQQDWCHLRGTYAHLYRRADQEARRLLAAAPAIVPTE